MPNRGIGYGMLRYLGDEPLRRELEAMPPAEVSFNYLGQIEAGFTDGSLFALAEAPIGAVQGPGGRRTHLVQLDGAVRGGSLELTWTFGREVHRRSTMERLSSLYLEELRGLVAHCADADAGGYTPSDFPLAGLDQPVLDALLGHERGVEDVYPLSPMQEGMVFHALYSPGSGMYVGQVGLELEGELDAEALRRAWADVVERHAALRAAFLWEDLPRSLQVVRRGLPLPFHQEDLRAMGEAEQAGRLEDFLREDRARGFELAQAPLMRLALFRTGEREHRFVWTHHHLITDGWTLPLIYREVLALYGAYSAGGRSGSPPRRSTATTWPGWSGGTWCAPKPSGVACSPASPPPLRSRRCAPAVAGAPGRATRRHG